MEKERYDVCIFTDGSCHTQLKAGAWAAILLYNGHEHIIHGLENKTTHQQMELQAVIQALHYVINHLEQYGNVEVITDSQYVTNLPGRMDQLIDRDFLTKKGKKIRNEALVKEFSGLLRQLPVKFKKVKAHQKNTGIKNFNRKVDRLVRKLLRENIKDAN